MNAVEILQANLEAILSSKRAQYPSDNAVEAASAAKGKKVGKSTVQRMRTGERAAGIDSLEAVAEVFGLQAWELLVPPDGNDPKVVKLRAANAKSWPFPTIKPEHFDGLSDREWQRLEMGIKNRLEEIKFDRGEPGKGARRREK